MRRTAALALLFVAAAASAASRPPDRDCAWTTLSDPGLGVDLRTQTCDFGFRTVGFETSAKDTTIYEVLTDTATRRRTRQAAIVLFSKKPQETPERAIQRVAFRKLGFKARRHCSVVAKPLGFLNKGKTAFTIAPDEEFAEEIARKAGDQIPPPPCGDMGELPDGFTYFEFHADSPGRFAFVIYGQDDHPLFDESSLTFRP